MNLGVLDGFMDAKAISLVNTAHPGNFTVIPWCVHTSAESYDTCKAPETNGKPTDLICSNILPLNCTRL